MSDQRTFIPEYAIAPLPITIGVTHHEQGLDGVMQALAPIEQRFAAVKQDLLTVRTTDDLRQPPKAYARKAIRELNDHFSVHATSALMLGATYHELLLHMAESAGPTSFEDVQALTFAAANKLVHTIGILGLSAARMPEMVQIEMQNSDYEGEEAIASLMEKFTLDSFSHDLKYVKNGELKEEDILSIRLQAVGLHTFPDHILDPKRAAGILALSGSLVFTTERTVDFLAMLYENQLKASTKKATPKSPAQKAESNLENGAQLGTEYDDSPVDVLLNVLGFNPASNKQLKQHELKKVLIVGDDVTLGQKYTFTGFGDKASIALGFIERINDVGATSVEEFAKVLDTWMNEAIALSQSRHISSGARKLLEQYVSAVEGCLSLEFCQVASHFAKSEPTKAAINYLKQLRTTLGTS